MKKPAKPVKAWAPVVDGEIWAAYCHTIKRCARFEMEGTCPDLKFRIARVIIREAPRRRK